MRNTTFYIIVVLLFSACSKDNERNPYPKLTSESWTMSGWILKYSDGGSDKTIDIFQNPSSMGYNECLLDDALSFLNNYTYQTILGTNTCSPETAIFGNGKWEIKDDVFTIEPTGYNSYVFTLIELSDTVLSFSKPVDITKKRLFIQTNSSAETQGIEIYTYKH